MALFVGVAGGIKDVAIGDVVFATEVHGYEYGKEELGTFLPRGNVARSSYALVEAARQIAYTATWLPSEYTAEAAPTALVNRSLPAASSWLMLTPLVQPNQAALQPCSGN